SQALGRWAARGSLARPLKKLAKRRVEGIPPGRFRTTDLVALLDPYFRRASANWFEFYTRSDRVFSMALNRWGTRGAGTVYSMMGEGWDFLRGVKWKGLII